MYTGGLYLSRNEKKAVFSFCSSLAIYNGQVTQRKELNKERVVTVTTGSPGYGKGA